LLQMQQAVRSGEMQQVSSSHALHVWSVCMHLVGLAILAVHQCCVCWCSFCCAGLCLCGSQLAAIRAWSQAAVTQHCCIGTAGVVDNMWCLHRLPSSHCCSLLPPATHTGRCDRFNSHHPLVSSAR
jgi:hypothetical protein